MAGNAAEEVAARLRVIQARAASEAPLAAVQALGQAGETAVKLTLTKRTHAKGTPTPSAPGQPPALVSGMLRRGVNRTPATATGAGIATQRMGLIGPAVVYGPVHEFGPVTIHAGSSGYLANKKTGQFFVVPGGPKDYVIIPKRPWMKPSMEAFVASGLASRACVTAFTASLFA